MAGVSKADDIVTIMSDGRTEVTFSPMRAAIARRMTQSKQTAPHFYVSAEMEMDALLEVADAHNAGRPKAARASVTAYLVRALALTLRDHPAFNAVWRGEVLELVDEVNIGVAIDLPGGLIAPALLDCAALDVDATADALRDLVERARAGRLRARELADGTFTLSNLGMVGGVSAFTAIITPPQVAILAIARAEPRPVARDGAIVVRRMLTATLSADHRAVDGAAAARFISDLRARLEGPAAWS